MRTIGLSDEKFGAEKLILSLTENVESRKRIFVSDETDVKQSPLKKAKEIIEILNISVA
jgi:hypothetical protein